MTWQAPRRLPWLLLISALVFVADRLTKTLVSHRIGFGEVVPIIPRVLNLTHWTNDGAAFSMFADSTSPHTVRVGLIAFTIVAALVVLIVLVRLGSRITLTTVALALILGGAIGNVIDRMMHGYVVDFLDFHVAGRHFPAFNVADSAITIGAICLILDELRRVRRGK